MIGGKNARQITEAGRIAGLVNGVKRLSLTTWSVHLAGIDGVKIRTKIQKNDIAAHKLSFHGFD